MIRLRENWRDTDLLRKVYCYRVQCDKHTLDVVDSIHYSYGISLLLYVYYIPYRFMSMMQCLTVMTLFMIS